MVVAKSSRTRIKLVKLLLCRTGITIVAVPTKAIRIMRVTLATGIKKVRFVVAEDCQKVPGFMH